MATSDPFPTYGLLHGGHGLWWFYLIGSAMAAPMMSDLQWRTVNDTVMGGVSSSTVQTGETVVFAGDLSLEQNGGFTSIRGAGVNGSLTEATGLHVVLRGDGRSYDLTVERSDMRMRAGSYRVQVETTAGETTDLHVPFADFRPRSYGRPVNGAPALDAATERIAGVGFLLADGNPGPFRLEVISIASIEGRQPRGTSYDGVLRQLAAAIGSGVPVFNSGDVAGCRDIYQSALTNVRTSDGLTPGERSLVDEALATATDQDASAGAWTLRYAMDSVLGAAGR
ncbi:MAG: NADH dehydrogenase [ubiquinone] 1 alpha subcomplex assembly factor 1 [Myxococcota bacterium]